MLCLRQVQATTEDARSRFGDDSEERNPLFFHRELLILPDRGRREISHYRAPPGPSSSLPA